MLFKKPKFLHISKEYVKFKSEVSLVTCKKSTHNQTCLHIF